MDYSFSEIVEIATALEREFEQLREDARNRYGIYTLRNEPVLPEDIAREGQVNILSGLVIKSAHSIRSDLLSNPTEFSVVPLGRDQYGRVPVKDQKKSDTLERTLAAIWARMNEGRWVDSEIIWHQLMSPFGVIILNTVDLDLPDQGDMTDDEYSTKIDQIMANYVPWSIEVPDPLTCAFYEKNGKPTLFIRRYKAIVRDVQNTYSKNRGSPQPDKNLRLNKGNWEFLSDDYERQDFKQVASDEFREVEMIWMDNGEMIYHVVLNPEDGKGQIVWSGKNPFGRVSAFIVHGSTSALRDPEDRFEPFLWPLIQVVKDINYVRTMRATASRNLAGPNNYIPLTPEMIKIFEDANRELPKTHRWRRGETPYLLGEVKDQPQHLDVDLDKLEERLTQDLQQLLPSPSVNVLDPAVLKAATATSILNAAEAGMRLYGPLMVAYDSTIRDICEALEYYVVENDTSIKTFATGEEVARGKNLVEGSVYIFDSTAFDFAHRIQVKTRSMSQAQASAQYELALSQWVLPDGSKGPATFDDLVDAANYPDKEAQKEKLAMEKMLTKIEPWIEEMAMASAITHIESELGIALPPPAQMGMQPAQQPSGMPNQAQRMASPLITGPQGGSSPPVS